MKKTILLLGGGGHCKSCIDVIEQLPEEYKIVGIVEKSGFKDFQNPILGYPIIGTDDELETMINQYNRFFITAGHINSSEVRQKLYGLLKSYDLKLPYIISPFSYVSSHATIGEGSIIMHGAIVNANAVIGNNCIINSRALIEHDAIIEDHCHVSTGSIINGGVKLGAGSFYGSGAVSKQYTEIPEKSFIKANSIAK